MNDQEKQPKTERSNPSGVKHTKESREVSLERIRKLKELLK